jgi:hypothetical protein
MRFDCGPTNEEKIKAKEQWHRRFAWVPVCVGSHDCRWLEYVERRGELRFTGLEYYWAWEYRPITAESE